MLAPNAKLRLLAVPQQPSAPAQAATEAAVAAGCEAEPVQAGPHRISWARLLKRMFDIDMQHCPNCGGGGELKIIADGRTPHEGPELCEGAACKAGSAAATQVPSARGGSRLKPRLSRAVRPGHQ